MDPVPIVDWSELPHDVLEHLTSCLPLRDYHRFGAVCQNWFLVAKEKRHPPAQQLPWLVLGDDDATQKRTFFDLLEKKHMYIDIPELRGQRVCGSSYGWLFALDIEINFHLLNPLTKKCYDLPALPPYTLGFDMTTCTKEPRPDGTGFTFEDMQDMLVQKAILDYDPHHSSDFTVLMVYGCHRKLACWSPGNSAWTLIGSGPPEFDDIVFFKQNFYAVGRFLYHNEIYLVDTGPNPELTLVEPRVPLFRAESVVHKYLVDFMGELLLVQRNVKETREDYWFTVSVVTCKIDLEKGKYSQCKKIDDLALFLGNSSPVIVDPSKFSRCRKNAIYFTDIPKSGGWTYGCSDLCLYDFDNSDRPTTSKYYPREIFVPERAAPTWLCPNPW